MPAPTIVTAEQVVEAAATLAEQGKVVTGWTLRGVIGAGRPDRLLAVWREQQGMPDPYKETRGDTEDRGLPPDCPPHVLSLAEDWAVDTRRYLDGLNLTMWQAAGAAAEQACKAEMDTLRARIAELDDELYRAERQVGALEASSAEKWYEAQNTMTAAVLKANVADAAIAKAQAEVVQARAEADGHRQANARLQATLDELVRRLPAVEQAGAA